jgi:hypothetical protein
MRDHPTGVNQLGISVNMPAGAMEYEAQKYGILPRIHQGLQLLHSQSQLGQTGRSRRNTFAQPCLRIGRPVACAALVAAAEVGKRAVPASVRRGGSAGNRAVVAVSAAPNMAESFSAARCSYTQNGIPPSSRNCNSPLARCSISYTDGFGTRGR